MIKTPQFLRRITGAAVLAAFAACGAGPGAAQQPPAAKPLARPGVADVDILTGALAAIKTSGTVRVGYREASLPFSYVNRAGQPVGYSIDICNAIVEEVSRQVDREDIKVQFVPVTSENRLQAIVEKKIDLECGSTTANAERRSLVSFSPMIFVAGTKVMVPRGMPWSNFRDLKGKTVVVTKGTTNEQTMAKLNEKFGLTMKIVTGADHEQSYQMLVRGDAEAFALDDVLLAGLIAHHKSGDKFHVVGELLSYDPYGIGYAKDDAGMTRAIDVAFKTLVNSGDMGHTYAKWFERRLPSGERFGLPMSPQLEEAFETFNREAGRN